MAAEEVKKMKLLGHNFNSCNPFDENKTESSWSSASYTNSQLSTLKIVWTTLRAFGISNLLSKSSGLIHHRAEYAKQCCRV